MKPTLHQVLGESHIAGVAILLLIAGSLESVSRALWEPLFRAVNFFITAVAILDIPYFSSTSAFTDQRTLIIASVYLYYALVSLVAAWLLSHWVYGVGPLRSLSKYHALLKGRNNV